MNEQLQQAVAALIDKSLKALDAGVEFLSGQLPDVIHQLLVWHMALNGAKALGAIIIAVLLVVGDHKAFNAAVRLSKENCDDSIVVLGWGMLGCIVRIPAWGMGVVALWNLTWLQIWLAPKIFLIEYAAKLTK